MEERARREISEGSVRLEWKTTITSMLARLA